MESHIQHHQTSRSHRRRGNNLWRPGHLMSHCHSSPSRWIISESSPKLTFSTELQLSQPLLSQGQLIFSRWSLLEYIKISWVWEKPEPSLCCLSLEGFPCWCPNFQGHLSLCRAWAASQCRMWLQAHKSFLPPQEVMSWCPFRKDAETTARKELVSCFVWR